MGKQVGADGMLLIATVDQNIKRLWYKRPFHGYWWMENVHGHLSVDSMNLGLRYVWTTQYMEIPESIAVAYWT